MLLLSPFVLKLEVLEAMELDVDVLLRFFSSLGSLILLLDSIFVNSSSASVRKLGNFHPVLVGMLFPSPRHELGSVTLNPCHFSTTPATSLGFQGGTSPFVWK